MLIHAEFLGVMQPHIHPRRVCKLLADATPSIPESLAQALQSGMDGKAGVENILIHTQTGIPAAHIALQKQLDNTLASACAKRVVLLRPSATWAFKLVPVRCESAGHRADL